MFVSVAWAQEAAEKTIAQRGMWDLLWDSHPLVKFVLLLLIGFSVGSWAIIFYKMKQLGRAQKDAENFWGNFAQSKGLEELEARRDGKSGPLYEIFAASLLAIPRLKKGSRFNRDIIVQKIAQSREEEIYRLEQYITFLATTASTAPFVGLFGTVWGILMAFYEIGKMGSSSLATVGPFISEALVATAIGLAAAIPAAMAYNYFVQRIKVLIKMMDLFVDDLILRIEEESNL